MGGTTTAAGHEDTLKKLKTRQLTLVRGGVASAQAQSLEIARKLATLSASYKANVKALGEELSGFVALVGMYEAQVLQIKALEAAKADEMKKGGDPKKIGKLEKSIQSIDKACKRTLAEIDSARKKVEGHFSGISAAADRYL